MDFRKVKDRLPAIAVVTVLLLGLGAMGWKFVFPPAASYPVAVKVPRLSGPAMAGKQAFDDNCAACHGENGAGTENGPPLVHDIYNPGHHNDNSFLRAVNAGVPEHHWNFGDMAPQPQVKRNEIAAIVEYVRVLQRANGIFWKQHRM